MSIDADAEPSGTRPAPAGRVLSFPRRAAAWAWGLGDRDSSVPVLAFVGSAMLLTQLTRLIHDVDIFWQLKLGELTLANGLPEHEPFLAGKQNEPLAAVAWLSQCVYAAVRLIGGWTLLWLVDAILWLGGFVVVASACGRRCQNVWPVVVGLWLGWFAALPSASLRPQSFAALAFGLLLVLMRSNLSLVRTAAVGAVLFLLWQNLHPSVAVGGGVLLAAVVAESVMYWLKRRTNLPWRLLVLLPIAAVATVATPAGLDIYRISAVNAELSRYLVVAEWQPLWWHPMDHGRPFAWPAMFLTGVGLIWRGRRARAGTLAGIALLTLAMLVSHRFMLFWGIALIPLWCELLAAPEPIPLRPNRLRRIIGDLAVALAVGLPLLIRPLPFAPSYPFAGIDALRASGRHGVVYCSYYWGGVLTDAGYPDWRVSHDGRYYMFTPQEWDDYFAATAGETTVEQIVGSYQPTAFFLLPGSDDGLIQRLRRHAAWRQLYADDNCIVFAPRNGLAVTAPVR